MEEYLTTQIFKIKKEVKQLIECARVSRTMRRLILPMIFPFITSYFIDAWGRSVYPACTKPEDWLKFAKQMRKTRHEYRNLRTRCRQIKSSS